MSTACAAGTHVSMQEHTCLDAGESVHDHRRRSRRTHRGRDVRSPAGRSVHLHHCEKGWHPTATLSVHEPEVRTLLRSVRSMPYREATRDTADPIGDQLGPRLSQRSQRYLQRCHAPVSIAGPRCAQRASMLDSSRPAKSRFSLPFTCHAQIQAIARSNRVNAFVDSLRSASVPTNCRIVSTDGAKLLL